MEKSIAEKANRISKEIFDLTGELSYLYKDEYYVMRICVEYLLRYTSEDSLSALKKLLSVELESANKSRCSREGADAPTMLEKLICEEVSSRKEPEADWLDEVIFACRTKKNYADVLCACIFRVETLSFSDNKFEHTLDGLLAMSYVKDLEYAPFIIPVNQNNRAIGIRKEDSCSTKS